MADEHNHGPGGAGGQPGGGAGGGQQQMLQMFQQKIGNLELTVNALIGVLVEADVIEEDEINEKAQEIIQELQDQQEGMNPDDIADELED